MVDKRKTLAYSTEHTQPSYELLFFFLSFSVSLKDIV